MVLSSSLVAEGLGTAFLLAAIVGLWDEVRQRGIFFRDMHAIARAPSARPS
jgi:hypothetical protein